MVSPVQVQPEELHEILLHDGGTEDPGGEPAAAGKTVCPSQVLFHPPAELKSTDLLFC